MKKTQILATVSALAFVVCGSTGTFAAEEQGPAESARANTGGLEEIVVTARRIEENLQNIPVAVTALSAAALQRRNVSTVSDIQFSVPNLQIKPSNTYSSVPEFIIRGQRQVLLTDENVVTYVNGVAQGTRGLTLYDLESVQALKGPQGTLFGKNSMGGAMVFTARRPTFETEGQLSAEFGNYDRKLVNAVVNLPLVADKVAIRAAGQIERQDGFFKNLRPGEKDLNNRHNESGRVSILIKPNDRFENLTTFDYIHRREIPIPAVIDAAPLANNFFRRVTQQGVTQQSALGGGTPFVDTARGVLVRTGNPFRSVAFTGIGRTLNNPLYPALTGYGARSEVYGVANTTTYELSDAITVKNIFGARHEKTFDYQDPSGLSGFTLDVGPTLGLPAGLVLGQVTNNDTYYQTGIKSFSNEFQVVGELPNLKFIGGAYYSHFDRLYAVNSSFVVGPASFYGPGFDRHSQMDEKGSAKALFGQGTYDFAGVGLDGLRLTAGLRYTIEKKRNINENFYTTSTTPLQSWNSTRNPAFCNEVNGTLGSTVGINNGAQCQISGRRTYKALTWTGSLEYQATNDTLLYFASRRGFKAGSSNPTTRSLQFNMFGPERITDFELGLKQQGNLGGVTYRVNIAGFIGNYKKIQTQDILQFCTNNNPGCAGGGVFTDLIVLNVGKATIKGVEVEASVKPVNILELNLGYAYQVGRYGAGSQVPQPTNPAAPVNAANPINYAGGVNLDGVEFAGVPRTTLTASATIDAAFVPESFAHTRLSVNYYYRSKTKGLSVQGIAATPSFNTVGARLSFDNILESNFSLAFWGANLAQKRYKLFCSDNLNSIGYAACKWGDPRTYGMTASVKF